MLSVNPPLIVVVPETVNEPVFDIKIDEPALDVKLPGMVKGLLPFIVKVPEVTVISPLNEVTAAFKLNV